jgi:hypothetical protein
MRLKLAGALGMCEMEEKFTQILEGRNLLENKLQ